MQPKPIPKPSVTAKRPVADLCETCVHGADCHLQEMPTLPVQQCNEYDDGTVAEPVTPVGLASVALAASEPESLVGLCQNCEHRDTCTIARPVGGVWHCEEYR